MAIKQRTKSLKSRDSKFDSTFFQLDVLNGNEVIDAGFMPFADKVKDSGHAALTPVDIEVLQLNVGKMCNQTCGHCHVDAGPDRKEIMTRETMQQCLDVIDECNIPKIDLTGGAPEMNPEFRWLVEQCSARGMEIMDRCNLTIIMANKKYHDLPEFYAKHKVHVISSLPYFSKGRTDSQRGDGVFEDSIKALKKLNAVGYAQEGSDLILDLVYNPSGAFLPADQAGLQAEFKRQLKRKFDIDFNSLFAITNLPIARFLEYLVESNNYEEYMSTLVDVFNPATVDGLMCRNTVSVGWDGYLFDCDFNQMLELSADVPEKNRHISNFNHRAMQARDIVTNQHCYGCTAGAGSSCGGEIV